MRNYVAKQCCLYGLSAYKLTEKFCLCYISRSSETYFILFPFHALFVPFDKYVYIFFMILPPSLSSFINEIILDFNPPNSIIGMALVLISFYQCLSHQKILSYLDIH